MIRPWALATVVVIATMNGAAHADEPSPPSAPTATGAAVDDTLANDDDDTGAPKAAITLLPFKAGRTITTKQAAGLVARLRAALSALADDGAITLLPTTRDDDKALRRCGVDAACYTDVAKVRGADRLIFGTVEVGDGGLAVIATTAGAATVSREVLITGSDDDENTWDRLARELAAPHTLRGALQLTGQPGDTITVDGRRRGTFGDGGTFDVGNLREGTHAVLVSRPEGRNGTLYAPFTRDVVITHHSTTSVKVTLLPKDTTGTLGDGDAAASDGPPVIAIVGVATGGALAAGGVVCGVLSLLDGFEVEKRATAQQLVFPRDEELVSRGRTLALVANVLYGSAAVVGGAGALWWALGTSGAPDESTPSAGETP